MIKKLMIVVIVFMLIIANQGIVSAHEIFYSGSPPYTTPIVLKWKWQTADNIKIHLKCNNDYIGTIWGTEYSSALGRWNSECGTDVYLQDYSFSYSKVDLCMPTESSWVDLVGYYNAYYGGVLGLTCNRQVAVKISQKATFVIVYQQEPNRQPYFDK